MLCGLLKRFVFLTIAVVSFCSSLLAVLQLVRFCSSQKHVEKFWNLEYDDRVTWDAIIWDLLLLGLFILQHSIMASSCFKNLIYRYRSLFVVERSIYIIMTSMALYTLISSWLPVYDTMIWHLDTSKSLFWWTVFFTLHLIAWILLMGAVLTMDLPELIGLKQVYFYCIGSENPIKYKTPEVRRLYRAMRHPGVSCFTFILWCYPVMSLDRFLLAIIFSLYLLFGFRVTVDDYFYVSAQSELKEEELRRYRVEVQSG